MKTAAFIAIVVGVLAALVAAFVWQDAYEKNQAAQATQEKWVAECHDESVLLATTTGSPSHHTCPNQHHVMHVQVASQPSNEEFGALVFCQCERDGGAQ